MSLIIALSIILYSYVSLGPSMAIGGESEYPIELQNYSIDQTSIDTDTSFLRSLGLTLPQDLVKGAPYSKPLGGRSFVIPTTAFSKIDTDIQQVMPAQLAVDLYLLEIAFQKAYGGWEMAKRNGWDWSKFFADWRAWLLSLPAKPISVNDAFEPFFKLKSVRVDNHSFPGLGALLARKIDYGSTGDVFRTSKLVGACSQVSNTNGKTISLSDTDKSQQFKRRRLFGFAAQNKLETGYYLSHPRVWGDISTATCDGEKFSAAAVPAPAFSTQGFDARQANILNLMFGSNSGHAVTETRFPIYRRVDDDISIIRMPSLTLSKIAQINSFVSSLPQNAGHEKVLIIDLRQNGGGFDTPAASRFYEGLKAWPELNNVLTDSSTALENMIIKNSCVADALEWGDSQASLAGLASIDKDAIEVYQRQLNKLFAADPTECPVSIEDHRGEWNLSKHEFKPQVGKPIFLVLVDNNCGSDCEWTTEMLAKLPQTIIAGANTFGVLQFVQPGFMILPNTEISFTVARGFSDLYGDGRSMDGYGIDVDVVFTDEAAHSEEGVLWLAKQLASDPKRFIGDQN